jgi:hypothetical protein
MEFTVPEPVSGYSYSTHFADECNDADLVLRNIDGNEYSTPERATATVQALWTAASQRAAA